MEIRKCELARRTIDRIAESDGCVICFADGAPVPVALVERDNMIVVTLIWDRRKIHNNWRFAVDPKRSGGEESALNAMCLPFPQNAAWRHICVAAFFPISRKRIKKILDFNRRREAREHFIFARSEPRGGAREAFHMPPA